MPPRARPTPSPSRRRMRWSVWPRPTDKPTCEAVIADRYTAWSKMGGLKSRCGSRGLVQTVVRYAIGSRGFLACCDERIPRMVVRCCCGA
eukprot:29135-Eustigmatos_ZCMA.PRE.1